MANKRDVKAFREALKKGETLTESMRKAGYPESMARQGKQALNNECKSELARIVLEKGVGIQELGRMVRQSPEIAQEAALGRLVAGALIGDDKGAQSAKQLGSWKELDLWQKEIGAAVQVNISGLDGLLAENHIVTPESE